MAEFDYATGEGAGAIAGIGGMAQSIPFLNIIAPGLTAGIAKGMEEELRNRALLNLGKIKDVEFSNKDYETGAYTGDFNPNQYAGPEAAQYKTIEEDPRLKEYQMQALSQLAGVQSEAGQAGERANRFAAMQAANGLAKQREGAVMANAQARGQGGSAMEFAMRQQAAQAGANRAQEGTLNASHQAALERLAGMNAQTQMAGAVRGQDMSQLSQNADIINRFNMHNTGARNQINMMNTQQGNNALLRNLDTRQQHRNAVANNSNLTLDRKDRNKQMMWQNDMKIGGEINKLILGNADMMDDANKEAQEAGKIGYDNYKSAMGGMGGGMGGMGMGG